MPAMQVATAMRKVVVPSVEWTGTMEDLQEAVEEEQHISSRKLNRPETNWRRNMAMVASPSQLDTTVMPTITSRLLLHSAYNNQL